MEPASTASEPAPPPPPPPPRRRGRRVLIWIAAILGVVILAVLIFAPPIIASVVRKQLVTTLNARVDGSASVGPVSFSWFRGAVIRDFEIKDRDGATVVSVKEASADLSVASALGGRFIARVRVDAPRVELRRAPDGRLNVTAILKKSDAPPPSEPATPAPPASIPRDLPYVDLKLDVTNASVLVAGDKESTQFDVSGAFSITHDKGRVTFSGNCDVGDGKLTLAGDADLQGAAKADVKFDRVPLDARMGPILELLHPAFSVAGGKLDGSIDGSVALQHPDPMSATGDGLLNSLSGNGRVEIRDCTFAGSNFLGQLMAALGQERREVKLRPVEFRVVDGRIVYDKPWQWTISGAETTFSGSIGLDRTLDLVWHVPLTDELAKKLRATPGQTYEIAIKGTVTSPRLDWKGLIKEAARDKIEEAAKGKLDELILGKDERRAKKLLEEADALQGEGKSAKAAEKYRKIKDDYRKTRVYKDNKERIDSRAEGK